MMEQIGNAIKFLASFIASKVGKTGLTVTVDVYSPSGSLLVTAGSASAVGGGVYQYTLSSGSVTVEGEYVAIFKTTDSTVDQQHVFSARCVGEAGVENLDATISSRNSTTPPTAASNASAVRTELATELGRIDVAVSTRNATTPPTAAANASAVRTELATELARVDATITSRSTLTATDVWTHATRVLTAFGFSVTVATNNDKSGYTLTVTPPTAAEVATQVRTELGVELARVDVDVSSRNATTPPTAVAVASQVRTELATELGRMDVAVSSRNATTPPTAAAVAVAVVDQSMSGHTTAGTVGGALNAAGSAGDPWLQTALDAYPVGSAGKLFSKLNVGTAEQPVFVLPSPPVDVSLCRVIGYLETIDGKPAAGVKIQFELIAAAPTASDKLVSGRKITVTTNADGRIVDDAGNLWIELQRNDLISPAGSKYAVTCKECKVDGFQITLNDDVLDLTDLLV